MVGVEEEGLCCGGLINKVGEAIVPRGVPPPPPPPPIVAV